MFPIGDSGPAGKFPFWVVVLILLNIYVFYLELTSPSPDAFITQFALIPALVDPLDISSLIPFVTSMFLHGGFLHIISNMWFLWIFGDNVEYKLGFLFFPVFYLLSGLAGGALQYIFVSDSIVPTLGASGAIAGVLGAYLALFPGNKVKTLVFLFLFITVIEIPSSLMLFYWLILQLFSGAAAISVATSDMGGIAYFAHVGGFVFGWFVGKILNVAQA
ncbi:MAG: Peptidase S54 family protein [Candidatus Daviesbacteria bacterium GW2011_GWA1_41_61]|uniref:Peptidase S54 family protein n=1 Tax=Candidatus Daviesbacteria bacterium GW2011_GWA2_40_9 TaxID=1618424 RepID=A0A0G0TZH8_9BACT|nr:MAG: hypothetical protein UU26_C0007G0018 [Candidatus Daviesbacteria bacterium GW2011_GWC1_40_9]KKR82304.1 MAG: Peptidase S54 family protein [Candidatus Daviesbacteria bacterium GW2011_GWA2_40_9]KKR93055.1 MAG: Peptidase S54 family protein [Candidatus Daviesbacteria bacterium GW2011_GWB1_41_15]KKS15599.1 MAG: Peptidase S54 family protein [Candidatus Daviesbacteria bacterium GW2011_GWA1_41_61]